MQTWTFKYAHAETKARGYLRRRSIPYTVLTHLSLRVDPRDDVEAEVVRRLLSALPGTTWTETVASE